MPSKRRPRGQPLRPRGFVVCRWVLTLDRARAGQGLASASDAQDAAAVVGLDQDHGLQAVFAGAAGSWNSTGRPRQAPRRTSWRTTLRSTTVVAAVVAVLDLDVLLARIVADQPDLGAALGRAAAADGDPVAARKPICGGSTRVATRPRATRSSTASGFAAGGLRPRRRPPPAACRRRATPEALVVGALAVGELRLGEGVLPAEVVPVVDRRR